MHNSAEEEYSSSQTAALHMKNEPPLRNGPAKFLSWMKPKKNVNFLA